MEFDFKMIFRQLGLGDPTAQPQRGTGGYLHKMLRVAFRSRIFLARLAGVQYKTRPADRMRG